MTLDMLFLSVWSLTRVLALPACRAVHHGQQAALAWSVPLKTVTEAAREALQGLKLVDGEKEPEGAA